MSAHEVVDEAVIHAPPAVVWDALLAEFHGARRWWYPENTFEPGAKPVDERGGETHITVHTKGDGNGGPKLRFTARTTAVVPGRRLDAEYVAGAFGGHSSFLLVPLLDGRATKLVMRFAGEPKGKLKFLSKLVNVDKQHSSATQAAFRRLDALLWADSPVDAVAVS